MVSRGVVSGSLVLGNGVGYRGDEIVNKRP